MELDVHLSGPLFDGTAAAAMRAGAIEVRHRLARDGEQKARAAFNAMIRDNEGVFISTITSADRSHVYAWNGGDGHVYTMPVVDTDPAVETIVTTGDAAYGPWLEGTGSRNQTTRFKGYHGFRLAAQQLDAEAGAIAGAVLQPFIERCR